MFKAVSQNLPELNRLVTLNRNIPKGSVLSRPHQTQPEAPKAGFWRATAYTLLADRAMSPATTGSGPAVMLLPAVTGSAQRYQAVVLHSRNELDASEAELVTTQGPQDEDLENHRWSKEE